jgi:hypothetical protein
MQRLIDEVGNTYGRLTVVARVRRDGRREADWRCQCACGNTAYVSGSNLRTGYVVSCGCYMRSIRGRANRSHGMSHTAAYRNWATMLQRCTNPKTMQYADYGGRGITVCETWRKFAAFHADMGTPVAGRSLERRDNNKGYSKDNCYWATRAEQSRNKRNNVLLTAKGETLTLSEWARRLGTCRATVRERLDRGWSVEDTCTRPIRGKALHIEEH